MNGTGERHRPQESRSGEDHQHGQRPYWKRAHQDWRVWLAVIVMIAGMVIYVMSDDFAHRPHQGLAPVSSFRAISPGRSFC
jgi:hypothetical protein